MSESEERDDGGVWAEAARVLIPLVALVVVALGVTILVRHLLRPQGARASANAEPRPEPGPGASPPPVPPQPAAPAAGGAGAAAARAGDRVRAPVVAGQFYPGGAEELRAQVDGFLGEGPRIGLRGVRALVVPHAGYVYSGRVAAEGYRELGDGFRRVFLLACNHSEGADYSGVALPAEARFAVPGGEIPVGSIADDLARDDLFPVVPAAHSSHVIEVHLPFLLGIKGWPGRPDFVTVPMVLGRMTDASRRRLADTLDRHVDASTVFVVSSDLSHYEDDATARRLDEATIDAILSRDAEALRDGLSCGADAIRALLDVATRRGWETTLLRYSNSGETSGDRSRVVGYAAVAFSEPLAFEREEARALLDYARRVVETRVRDRERNDAPPRFLEQHPIFRVPRGVFVTLKQGGQLRGCIGRLTSARPLWESVRDCAIDAAINDERFVQVTPEELGGLGYSISILSFPCRLKADGPDDLLARLRPGRDGVILRVGERQATYLPQVWTQIPDPRAFMENLAHKAGCEPGAWRDPGARVYVYGAHVIGEEAGG